MVNTKKSDKIGNMHMVKGAGKNDPLPPKKEKLSC